MSALAPGSETPLPAGRVARFVDWLDQRLALGELFSFVTHFGIVYTPVDTRRPLREELRRLARTPVESYVRWPHVLGLLTALLFLLEAVSGVLLAFYYQPTAAAAYESTRSIVRDVPLGWLVHQTHAWGAYLLVAVVLVRLARLFWDRLYQPPRELLWFAGVALAWLVLQLDFTGLLLPWDVQSYWAAVRGLEVVWSVPVVGPMLSFLVGGRTMSEDVLDRFYVLHIIVLPILYLGFVYLTFATMRRVGLSSRTDGPKHLTTYRRHLIDLGILTLLLFAGLVTIATLLPFHFHGAADPYLTPPGTRPPWYMLAPYTLFQAVRWPAWIPGIPLLALALALPFLPWWGPRLAARIGEWRFRFAFVGLVALWLLLTVAGVFVDRR